MGGMAASVVSQLVVPVLSTGLVSSMKQKALTKEANKVADVIEERVRDFFGDLTKHLLPQSTLYIADDEETLQRMVAEDDVCKSVLTGKSAIGIATSLVGFLVKYPEAVAGEVPYKDIVCDLFSAVADLVPVMKWMELPEDTISYAELLVQEVTRLVAEDNAKEAADMVYEGIKQLCTSNAIMEVINGVVQ